MGFHSIESCLVRWSKAASDDPLILLIGQLLNTFGSVQTYEHVTVDGSGRYRPAALLHPNT
jgi:hypothetical protein